MVVEDAITNGIRMPGSNPVTWSHLSVDTETARVVGRRRDKDPVVLIVDARQAWKDGILLYEGGSGIWLADSIPVRYIHVELNNPEELSP